MQSRRKYNSAATSAAQRVCRGTRLSLACLRWYFDRADLKVGPYRIFRFTDPLAPASHLCLHRGGNVQKPHGQGEVTEFPQRNGGYAEWIALGAVAAGSVGAILGMANRRRHASQMHATPQSDLDPETVTAPHGDKLRGAVV